MIFGQFVHAVCHRLVTCHRLDDPYRFMDATGDPKGHLFTFLRYSYDHQFSVEDTAAAIAKEVQHAQG